MNENFLNDLGNRLQEIALGVQGEDSEESEQYEPSENPT